jgi:hypothetical protein
MDQTARKDESTLLGFVGWVAAIVGFIYLAFGSIEGKRDIYFGFFGDSQVPQGSYSAVIAKSSRLETNWWSSSYDKYSVTLRGGGGPTADPRLVELTSSSSHLYSLECRPHFYNRCAGLQPERTYFARWVTTDDELAVSELITTNDKKTFVDPKKMQFYKVTGWQEVPATANPTDPMGIR